MSSLTRLGGEDITKIKTLQSVIDTLNSTNTSLTNEISTGKSSISTAITNKGVATSASSTFDIMAANIGNIATGKKFASGTVTNPAGIKYPSIVWDYRSDSSVASHSSFECNPTIVQLNFTPSIVILNTDISAYGRKAYVIYYKDLSVSYDNRRYDSVVFDSINFNVYFLNLYQPSGANKTQIPIPYRYDNYYSSTSQWYAWE